MKQVEAAVIGVGWVGGTRAETLARTALVDKLHLCEIRPDRLAEVKALYKPATTTLNYQDIINNDNISVVFISTTPNPTTGYMQIVPLDEVSETGWSVEEAVRILISGGVLSPEKVAFDRIRKVAWEPSLNWRMVWSKDPRHRGPPSRTLRRRSRCWNASSAMFTRLK